MSWGAMVALSVKLPTLDFRSGMISFRYDLMDDEIEPCAGLMLTGGFLEGSLPLPLPQLMGICTLSLSNK